MKRIQNFILFPVALLSMALFFMASFGHPMSMGNATHRAMDTGSVTDHCKSICSPFLTEKQKAPANEEREAAKPDPFIFAAPRPGLYASLLYMVALSALCLAFLKRRPPDLVIEYAALRN